MRAADQVLEAGFEAGPAELAAALSRVAAEDAASIPLIDEGLRRRLTAATRRLPFRPAIPAVGEGERRVQQEFELCMTFPPESLFRAFAAALGRLVDAALAHLDPAPLARPFVFNDLIVQRYPRGALGITAHRDHIRYEGLVALVPLSGAGRFFLCADRAGHGLREVSAPRGCLLLMRAPGFAGRRERPFHLVRDITAKRLSLGLRHDVRAV